MMPLLQVFANSSALASNVKLWRYCPRCGTGMAKTGLLPFERQRCSQCGTVNYLNPAPGITMLIRSPSQLVLIGKRAATARYGGQWCLPGGYIEYEESFIDTAFREIHEETGLQVRIEGVVNVVSNQLDDRHHTLVIVLIGDVVAGEPRAGDDLAELHWADKAGHEATSYAFEADRRIIDSYFAGTLRILPLDGRYTECAPSASWNRLISGLATNGQPLSPGEYGLVVENNGKAVE